MNLRNVAFYLDKLFCVLKVSSPSVFYDVLIMKGALDTTQTWSKESDVL